MIKFFFLFLIFTIAYIGAFAQQKTYTHTDSLRGSITSEREWWDVLRYDVTVKPDIPNKTISGSCLITFKAIKNNSGDSAQIDLQDPMILDKISIGNSPAAYRKEGSFYHVKVPVMKVGAVNSFKISFHGMPKISKFAPWDGGWVWTTDSLGRPWVSPAVQGLGASSWFPCKDHQSDEPDNGASLSIIVPDDLTGVGNGRLISKIKNGNGTTTYKWEVRSPINSYDIIPYIGKYVNFSEVYHGEEKDLDVNFWSLDYNLDRFKSYIQPDVDLMLKAHEFWMGPYPFNEDGFKIVEAPYLGMEHQSSIAYGNKFKRGFLGLDRSKTGQGLKWDYIIVHECGHEWFGNNITTKDIADMWVHEGFTTYSEALYTEYYFGRDAADEYIAGKFRLISNDRTVIGNYGVNNEGSVDMYEKGSSLISMIRLTISNDTLFREILRGLNKDYYHQTVTSNQVENYISERSGIDFSNMFDQYLRTKQVPQLSYYYSDDSSKLHIKWDSCIAGFDMPITHGSLKITPSEQWQVLNDISKFEKDWIEKHYYIRVKEVKAESMKDLIPLSK
ncbi:M1 family metallopeptidase [soil metagenome]